MERGIQDHIEIPEAVHEGAQHPPRDHHVAVRLISRQTDQFPDRIAQQGNTTRLPEAAELDGRRLAGELEGQFDRNLQHPQRLLGVDLHHHHGIGVGPSPRRRIVHGIVGLIRVDSHHQQRHRSQRQGRQIGGVVGSDRLRSGHLVRLWPNRAEQPTGGTKAHHSSGKSQNGPQWMTAQPGHQPLRLGGRHRPQAGYGA